MPQSGEKVMETKVISITERIVNEEDERVSALLIAAASLFPLAELEGAYLTGGIEIVERERERERQWRETDRERERQRQR